jgi:RNA polymerase sigma-70 factor (ECF subfamily)
VTTSRPPDFSTLYRCEFSYVWKTLRRLGAPDRDLEDLAHDVFVVVHRHLADYDSERPLRPWLFGITMRVLADFRRVLRNQCEIPSEIGDAVDAAPSADAQLAESEARAVLMKALDGLDLDRRAVFVMHELDEVSAPEIAAALAVPLNTVYSRLRLARVDVTASIRRFRAKERES